MAFSKVSYEVRSIREEDAESAGSACFEAFDGLAKQLNLLHKPDFPSVDNAIAVVNSKVRKLSDTVDGIVAVGSDGKVLGGCFGEQFGDVIAVGPVFVRPDAGGCGVGKAVCAALLNKLQERQWTSVRLVQNTMNNVSFRLYTSLGFRVGDIWSYFKGPVKRTGVLSYAGFSVRRLEAGDIPACNALHFQSTGFHREQRIREEAALWPTWVVTKDDEGGRIVGYRTAPIVTGHGVFETEEAFAALHEKASRELQETGKAPLALHIPCRLYPQLVEWALRAGLTLVRQKAHMVIGACKDPKARPIYSPSIEA